MSAKAQPRSTHTEGGNPHTGLVFPSIEKVIAEIKLRAIDSKYDTTKGYKLYYYCRGGYFGASIDTVVFSGNFWKALLEIDDYLSKNCTECNYPAGEFIKTQYNIVVDTDNWKDTTPNVYSVLSEMSFELFDNDTLWIEDIND
jgi:hypothetical protein